MPPETETVYCILDLETGGLDPAVHAIGSAAMVRLGAGLAEVDHFEWLVADLPDKLWTPKAIEVNGLDPARCRREGGSIAGVLLQIAGLVGDRVVVCHNADFDLGFLASRGLHFGRCFCTLELARRVWPGSRNRLTDVAYKVGYIPELAHTALEDCRTTAAVLRWMARTPRAAAHARIRYHGYSLPWYFGKAVTDPVDGAAVPGGMTMGVDLAMAGGDRTVVASEPDRGDADADGAS